jgi:hypothetical protein
LTEQFGYRVTKDDRVLVTFRGRHVVTVAGAKGEQLAAALAEADGEQEQLLLAKATGNFKRGNERRVNG